MSKRSLCGNWELKGHFCRLGLDCTSANSPECAPYKIGDSISEIITELKFADKLPISEGHINSLMDARDRLNELIAVSVHQMLDSSQN